LKEYPAGGKSVVKRDSVSKKTSVFPCNIEVLGFHFVVFPLQRLFLPDLTGSKKCWLQLGLQIPSSGCKLAIFEIIEI
jgi:hypothetical protein